MTREQTISKIEAALGDRLLAMQDTSPRRVFIEVLPDDIPQASRVMFDGLEARFQIATGVDTPDAIELMYHWALDRLGLVITLRTWLDRQDPKIESLAPFCPAAEWVEREIWELLGVQFQNHPDLRHLLLSDDWPDGKYPLRRDYEA